MGFEQFEEVQPWSQAIPISPGTGIAFNTLVDSPGRVMRVDAIYLRNYDVIDHIVELGFQPAGTNYQFATVNVPSKANTLEGIPIEMIGLITKPEMGCLRIGPTNTLQIRVTVACTTGNLYVVAFGGYF